MGNGDTKSNLELVRESVAATRESVVPSRAPVGGPEGARTGAPHGGKSETPNAYDQGVSNAVQSIAQSAAIAIQDATDLMRNVSTVETTAIGAATAKWLATPENVAYKEVIEQSLKTIKGVADVYKDIGTKTADVLKLFDVT